MSKPNDNVMADITMCPGSSCKIRDKCYRHTAPINEHWQAWNDFSQSPVFVDGKCELFTPNDEWVDIKTAGGNVPSQPW